MKVILRTYQSRIRSNPLLNLSRALLRRAAAAGYLLPSAVSCGSTWLLLRTPAAIAGLRVIATNTDSAIAETMVAENCR